MESVPYMSSAQINSIQEGNQTMDCDVPTNELSKLEGRARKRDRGVRNRIQSDSMGEGILPTI